MSLCNPGVLKQFVKKTHASFEYLEALLAAIDKAKAGTQVYTWLELDKDFMQDKVAGVYVPAMLANTKAVEAGMQFARSSDVDFDSDYQMPKLPAEDVMAKVNSETARALKEKWTPLVNGRKVVVDEMKKFRVERFEFLNLSAIEEANGQEEFEETYAIIRNKICEIFACRALCRPVPNNETPSSLAQKCTTVIEHLEGVLPGSLGLLLANAAKAKAE